MIDGPYRGHACAHYQARMLARRRSCSIVIVRFTLHDPHDTTAHVDYYVIGADAAREEHVSEWVAAYVTTYYGGDLPTYTLHWAEREIVPASNDRGASTP